MSVGRLELPTNGLKGHCSAIELHAHSQAIIVARPADSVNKNAFGFCKDLKVLKELLCLGIW